MRLQAVATYAESTARSFSRYWSSEDPAGRPQPASFRQRLGKERDADGVAATRRNERVDERPGAVTGGGAAATDTAAARVDGRPPGGSRAEERTDKQRKSTPERQRPGCRERRRRLLEAQPRKARHDQ